jgi:hypothetical protein
VKLPQTAGWPFSGLMKFAFERERGDSFAPWVTARPYPMVETPPEAERKSWGRRKDYLSF